MNDFEKNLNEAIDALKQEKIPDGPSERSGDGPAHPAPAAARVP